jgi:hypothetical protein
MLTGVFFRKRESCVPKDNGAIPYKLASKAFINILDSSEIIGKKFKSQT